MSARKHELQRIPKVATALSGRGALAAWTVFLVRSRFVAWLGQSPLPKDGLSRWRTGRGGSVFKNANPALRIGLLSPGPCGTDFPKPSASSDLAGGNEH